jgi:hypothetical protein
MSWDDLNVYYYKNPPKMVLDGMGVHHINETPLPAKYKPMPCRCGIVHDLDSNTWFHKGIMYALHGIVGIYRACKECGEILAMELDDS